MNQVLNMELGFSIISLASRMHFLDTITSQHIVNVFVTMMNTEGCVNRHMVESFLRQVFLKYLHVAWYLVSAQVRQDFPLVELLCPSSDIPNFASSVEVELLEYLVDSLCDLLASVSFLPSIYATFDCNLSSPDIAGALVKNISNLSRLVLSLNFRFQYNICLILDLLYAFAVLLVLSSLLVPKILATTKSLVLR